MALAAPAARLRAALALALFALAAAVFWPIREHAFVNYDDDHYITREPALALGLSRAGFAWAFTSQAGANWFPATRVSWLFDHARAGLDPRAFHTTDLVLHALAAALLFLALARMTQRPWPCAFAAAVFAVHPLHVEAVAWASARKDTLAAVCFGAALLCASGARGRAPSRGERLGVLACLAVGLMAKPTLVTFPFLLLLLDAWPLGRLGRAGDATAVDPRALGRALREKLPLFALVALVCAVVVHAQAASGAMVPLERIPLAARIENALAAIATYLRHAFWPSGLAVFYPHPVGTGVGGGAAQGLLLLAGLTLAAAASWRRRPYLLVGWLWFLGMLVPTLGFVQVGVQAHADRYTYLPLTGLAIAVAWGAGDLLAACRVGARARQRALAVAGVAALGALAGATSLELRHWRDSEALFRRALAVTRDNYIAHGQLGDALLEQGRPAEAAAQWEAALRAGPAYLEAANNLAWLLATTPDAAVRRPERALVVALHARALSEGVVSVSVAEHASVLDTLAAAEAAAGRFAEAVATAEQALGLAERAGDAALAAELRQRAALYRSGVAFVER